MILMDAAPDSCSLTARMHIPLSCTYKAIIDMLAFIGSHMCHDGQGAVVEFVECNAGRCKDGNESKLLQEFLRSFFSPDVTLVMYGDTVYWDKKGYEGTPYVKNPKDRIVF